VARIRPLSRSEFDPELQELTREISDDDLGHLRIFAQAPTSAHAWVRFIQGTKAAMTLPPRLIEIVRLRVAFHNQCPHCMAVRQVDADGGVTESLVCSLEKPEEAPDLSPAERSALRYADLMATDHFAIDDAVFDDLRIHFSEPEIVELGIHLAMFVGFGRLGYGWRYVEGLPDSYRTGTTGDLHYGEPGVVVGSLHADG
jgi:alkylhydroperoxidase family enzyme